MLYNELMKAIEPHLRGDRDIPEFVCAILGRLSSVPERLWFTTRDKTPGADHADTTLRKFYNRGLSKTLARKMLSNPTRIDFVNSLYVVDDIEKESAEEIREALARAIEPFTDLDIDESNVGNVLFDLFQQSFEFIVNPELENDRKLNMATSISDKAKGRFGSRILEECKYTCSKNGCGQHLQVPAANNRAEPLYEITRIVGDSRDYPNLIALCPSCFHAYILGHKKKEEKELKKNKQIQTRFAEANGVLSTIDIERGITKVIEKIGNAKPQDFEQLSFDPVTVKTKIDERVDFFLCNEVINHVTKYYRFIEKQMQEEAKLKTFDDDLLRSQIKALSKKLTSKKYSKMHIHADLSDRLSQITKQDVRYCAFVVSYFVQSCEVFDVTA